MKLKQYLHTRGIKIKSFAEMIGVHPTLLCSALRGQRRLPVKSWRKITILTDNKVTLEDLYNAEYPE